MGVSFDEGQSGAPVPVAVAAETRVGGLTGLFMRMGVASTPAGVQTVMLALAILMLGASAFLFFFTRPKPPVVSAEEREELLLELKRGADGRSRLR
jgi:hypothetical protein